MDEKFIKCLYQSKSVPEALDMYCRPMLNDSNVLKRLKVQCLLQYWAILMDYTFFETRIYKLFRDSNQEIKKVFPDISYELLGRLKSLISTINKVDEIYDRTFEEFQKKFMEKIKVLDSQIYEGIIGIDKEFEKFLNEQNLEKSNPFNRIKDFFAFRIVISDSDGEDHNQEAYDIANFLIDFLRDNSFQVVESASLLNTGELKVKSPLIKVPKKTGLKLKNVKFCKDYIFHPKSDGYQGLHIVVYDPYTARFFEIQIRTESMDIIAETFAAHSTYKEEKYGEQRQATAKSLDYSKITIDDFRYLKYQDPVTGEEKEYIRDRAGVIEPIPLKLDNDSLLKKLQKSYQNL